MFVDDPDCHYQYTAVWTVTGLVVDEVKDKKDRSAVARVIRTAIMSKQYGLEDFLAGLVADACSQCSITVNSCHCLLSCYVTQ